MSPRQPHDPRNILAGAAFLRLRHDRFGYPGLFAAYNAGPARYAGHLSTGHPLPGERRAYLASMVGSAPTVADAPKPARSIFSRLLRIPTASRRPVTPKR